MALANNRKAKYQYQILNEYDAGIILTGNEVKSVRNGNLNIKDSYIFIEENNVYIKNMFISKYRHAHSSCEQDEYRVKKLLLTKKQIKEISKKLKTKGLTCICLKVFTKGNRIKVKVGVAKGKKLHDKRNSLKEKEMKRSIDRANV